MVGVATISMTACFFDDSSSSDDVDYSSSSTPQKELTVETKCDFKIEDDRWEFSYVENEEIVKEVRIFTESGSTYEMWNPEDHCTISSESTLLENGKYGRTSAPDKAKSREEFFDDFKNRCELAKEESSR